MEGSHGRFMCVSFMTRMARRRFASLDRVAAQGVTGAETSSRSRTRTRHSREAHTHSNTT